MADLDEVSKSNGTGHIPGSAGYVIERLIERLKRAEAVINQAMREEAKTQRIMTGRLPTTEASSATWRVLATYKNGDTNG